LKTTFVIPTYWGRPVGVDFNPTDVVYDHPTPLNLNGTLARALDSFAILNRSDFNIIVIAAATHPELESFVEKKVAEITDPFKHKLNLGLISPEITTRYRKTVEKELGREFAALISCYGYSNIRNLCLIAGHAIGADNIILIDDDELIEYPEFLDKALEFMPGSGDGSVKAKAGWYMRPDGGYKGPPTRDAWWMGWQGAEAMNEGFDAVIGQSGRLGKTPFAFGGNMVISREVFTQIAFDPQIPRGEDIDYVFNAMMSGIEFVMDRELWIRHLPPASHVPDWQGFQQNALRFTYARQKLATQITSEQDRTVLLEELNPYPGRFLGPDLDEKIKATCALLGQRYISEGDTAGYHASMLIPELVEGLKGKQNNACRDYLDLEKRWRSLMQETGKGSGFVF
jgi:hypothetical protein